MERLLADNRPAKPEVDVPPKTVMLLSLERGWRLDQYPDPDLSQAAGQHWPSKIALSSPTSSSDLVKVPSTAASRRAVAIRRPPSTEPVAERLRSTGSCERPERRGSTHP